MESSTLRTGHGQSLYAQSLILGRAGVGRDGWPSAPCRGGGGYGAVGVTSMSIQ